MVSVGRYRERGENRLDRTVGRYRRRPLCTVGRCNRWPPCTVGRSKACVFERRISAVRAAHERLYGALVVAGMSIQALPRDRIPARLVGAVAFDGLMNKATFEKLALRLGQHVRRLPSPLLHVGSRQQQSPVVVSDVLPGHLQKKCLGVEAQCRVGGRIDDRPWQGHKPACVAPRATLAALVAPVHVNAVPAGSASR